MSVAAHLGISLSEYDARIRTFVPHYETMLDEAAAAVAALAGGARTIVDLGTGTGALAARCLAAAPRATIVGIDADAGILDAARRRLGRRLTAVAGDFLHTSLPRCDAMTASLALHHIRTTRTKAAFYRRAHAALRPGGLLVSADCCPASSRGLEARDRAAWLAHLGRTYTRAQAAAFLAAWAHEDVYLPLADELALLARAGFTPEVRWRRDGFAVIIATTAPRRAPSSRGR